MLEHVFDQPKRRSVEALRASQQICYQISSHLLELFSIPALWQPWQILGLGDIAIPGLLVSLLLPGAWFPRLVAAMGCPWSGSLLSKATWHCASSSTMSRVPKPLFFPQIEWPFPKLSTFPNNRMTMLQNSPLMLMSLTSSVCVVSDWLYLQSFKFTSIAKTTT